MLRWDHWHIEPSSICTLKCPRCPRAEVSETLLNKQLSLKFFQDQIGADTVSKIKKITFCGNDGDPIYCKEFLDICRWIKEVNNTIQLVIITNGSYKSNDWWESLASVLNGNDEIHFSLDGWDHESNSKYRVNSDWESIISGIKSFTKINSSTYLVWAFIAFRFNELMIDKIKDLAQQLKFDAFQLTKSTKFGSKYPDAYGSDDLLEPNNKNLISSSHRFERDVYTLTEKTRPGNDLKLEFIKRAQQLNGMSGLCLIGNKGVFLNSQGEFYPCCWVANRYSHNKDWIGKFNLNTTKFSDILLNDFWTTDFLKFDNLECSTKCTADKLTDLHHISEW